MTEDLIFRAAVDRFGLGTCLSVAPVTGGLSNDLWRLETTGGTVAMKVMVANADAPDFHDNVETAYAIELNAFRRGVPCPEPMGASPDRCLARIEGQWVRMHRWVEGSAPRATRRTAAQAGVLLAQIHAASPVREVWLDDEPWDVERWGELALRPCVPAALADLLTMAAPSLAALEELTAAPGLAVAHVSSHGDLDPKNTLLVNERLVALDWDAARVLSVEREAASVALDWSPGPEEFRRVLDTYTQASGTGIPREPWILGGWVSALGGWLAYNVTERIDTEIGRDEAAASCRRLTDLHADLSEYLAT